MEALAKSVNAMDRELSVITGVETVFVQPRVSLETIVRNVTHKIIILATP